MCYNVLILHTEPDSVEVGITTIDTYFDTLGGISRAVKKARKLNQSKVNTSDDLPVYIADNTQGTGSIRGISEQVALETRTRALNRMVRRNA